MQTHDPRRGYPHSEIFCCSAAKLMSCGKRNAMALDSQIFCDAASALLIETG
jgi:hypothetical protein